LVGLLGRWAEQHALLVEVAEAANLLRDPALITHVRLREKEKIVADPASDLGEARRIVEGVIEMRSELGDQQGLASADALYAPICVREGRMAEALAHWDRALAAAEANGWRSKRRAHAIVIAKTLPMGSVPVGEATRRCAELILIDPSDRMLEARVSGYMSALVAMAGRAEEALELAARTGRDLDELTVIPSLHTRNAVAEAKEYVGDRAAAIEERETIFRTLDEIAAGRPSWPRMCLAYRLALLYCDEGRWDDAERRLAYGRELPALTHFREEAVLRLAGRARVAAHHGRTGEAVGLATNAVALAQQSDMLNLRGRVWEALAEVQRAAGREADAAVAVAAALVLYEQKENVAAAARLRSAVGA